MSRFLLFYVALFLNLRFNIFLESGNFGSRSDYSGTGANSEPFVPRKPGSGKFKAMAAEVTIDLSFLKRPTDKPEPSKPVQGRY